MKKNIYRTFAREQQNDAELEALEKELENATNGGEQIVPDEALSPEEKSFKKRYGDLRAYAQKKEDELRSEIAELRNQMQAMAEKNFTYPKTEEEVSEWLERYPDVGKIVETIALKASHKTKAELDDRIKAVEAAEQSARERAAYAEFLAAHPDFEDIRETQDWADWIELQPKYIFAALYENSTDAKAAIRAVDLFKADQAKKSSKKSDTRSNNDAAHSIRTASSASPAPTSGRPRFTESMVAKMSQREFDANEDAIMEAMQSHDFYDLSGGAR